MNYLQLIQKLHEESGLPGDPPASVTNATGQALKLKNWIDEAWLTIQEERKWNWRWSRFSFDTQPGVFEYDLASDPDYEVMGRLESVWAYDPAISVTARWRLKPMRWIDFESEWPDPAEMDANKPDTFTLTPSGRMLLAPVPDKVYTIRGEMYIDAQQLVNDDDEPIMPPQFRQAIVWKAAQFLAEYYGNTDLLQLATRHYLQWRAMMERDTLPMVTFGVTVEPMA